MAKTEIHEWPLPELTSSANVPQDMKNLADQIDRQTPFVCTQDTRPAPIAGLIIYETDTKRTWIADGSAWSILGQEWRAFTPAFNGWERLGTGYTAKGMYSVAAGGMVTVQVRLKAGTNASMGKAALGVTGFPVKAAVGIQQFGTCSLLHTGPNGLLRTATMVVGSGNAGAGIFILQGAATAVTPGNAGVPWQAGSELHGTITYASALGRTVSI